MSVWQPTSKLAKAVDAAGFRYDPNQDIIYSKQDAWQRDVGYCWAYDVACVGLRFVIDCETFYFWYDKKPWLIELWKGQYGHETGAEIGVYRDDGGAALFVHPRSRLYACTYREPISMSFRLFRKGEELLSRSGRHWWLTGFKWGVFTEKTSDLVMQVEIDFPCREMRDAFNEALIWTGYPNSARGNRAVSFCFSQPHVPQPGTRKLLEGKMQADNGRLVADYNLLKVERNISTNDPNAFTESDGQVNDVLRKLAKSISTGDLNVYTKPAKEVVQLTSGGAANVRSNALASKKKLQSKPPAMVRGVRSQPSAAAKKTHNTAAAAVGALLSNVPDEASDAYDQIATFFDKKVWHVTRQL